MQIPQIPMAFAYWLLAFRCTWTSMKLPAGDLGETPDPDLQKLNFSAITPTMREWAIHDNLIDAILRSS
jgi:hypothetical protein